MGPLCAASTLSIPRPQMHFVIPKEDPKWPERLWGKRLGNSVSSIRSGGCYDEQTEADAEALKRLNFCYHSVLSDKLQLEAIGFVWNFFEAEWSERILPALKILYNFHGHSRVPTWFEVPSDAAWPAELHGLKLGPSVQSNRFVGTYFDQTTRSLDELETIEFRLEIPVAKWKQRVEPWLTTFEDLHGHRSVPFDFVVPSSAPWVEKDWGIPLGKLQRKGVPVEAN